MKYVELSYFFNFSGFQLIWIRFADETEGWQRRSFVVARR